MKDSNSFVYNVWLIILLVAAYICQSSVWCRQFTFLSSVKMNS